MGTLVVDDIRAFVNCIELRFLAPKDEPADEAAAGAGPARADPDLRRRDGGQRTAARRA
jgi:hypothetical protein